jgi:hypothetical protein
MTNNTGINNVASRAHMAVEKASDAIHGVTDDAAGKARLVIDGAAHAAHKAVSKAASEATPAVAWLGNQAEAVMAAPRQLVMDGQAVVVRHPWKALGIALAAGFLISRVLR